MRAGIYLRMSEDPDDDQLGIDRQREDCLKVAEKKGWAVTEYIDNDRSATRGVRPAYQTMLQDIRDDRLDAIIAWHPDRLYRKLTDLLPLIELCNGHNIQIATHQSGDIDLSTDSGRLVAKILGAVAEGEGERRTARQTRALRQVAESGRGWGQSAFGYSGTSITGNGGTGHQKVALIPEEAEVIREAYKAILAGGTLHGIAAEWNANGHKTRRGNAWSGHTVRRLLMNPRNAGLRAYKGEVVGKGDWPAIIPEDTWAATTHLLADPARRTYKTLARINLLGGILRCGTCGKGLTSARAYVKGKESRRLYKCKNGNCTRGVVRQVEPMEAWVRELVLGRLSQEDWAPEYAVEKEEGVKLYEEANIIRARMDSLAVDFAEGELTASQLKAATDRLHKNLATIEARIGRTAQSRVFDGILGAKDIAAVYDNLPLDRRRALVQALISAIVVNPLLTPLERRSAPIGTGIEVHWNQTGQAADGRKVRTYK